jgi:hypothetical protein
MREPVQIVEIDVDYCSLTYGTSPCDAALGTTGVRKCFNMYRHCQSKQNFDLGVKTLRFAQPRANMPKSQLYFPCLESASPRSATVNLGGADSRLDPLGRRATATVRLRDFPYHDREMDKYRAGRVDGTAQTDEGGYKPEERGTFFRKLKTRWPYYAGRPLRIIDGYIDGGVLTEAKTRHYVITDMGMDSNGSVTIDGKDVLDLAGNKKATCPRQTQGVLVEDITATATSFTMTPEGIGDAEYAASGRVVIGSEVMAFTRSGDVMTVTRGQNNTDAAAHSSADAVQLCFEASRQRLDDVIYDLLVNYAGIPSSFIPLSDWEAEVTRWGTSIELTTVIPKPEGVSDLVGELAVLGVNIWWDDVAQKVRLKMVRPPDGDDVYTINDDNAIKSASVIDLDEDRITRVAFFSAQIDPTKSVTATDNYKQQWLFVDPESESDLQYNSSKTREIFCRWLNTGDATTIRIAARRLLQRLKDAPQRFTVVLDAKDNAIAPTDVLRVTSSVFVDETGAGRMQPMQVLSVKDKRSGHDFEVMAQSYNLDVEIGYCAPNDAPTYAAASSAERLEYIYCSENTGLLPDGAESYRAV